MSDNYEKFDFSNGGSANDRSADKDSFSKPQPDHYTAPQPQQTSEPYTPVYSDSAFRQQPPQQNNADAYVNPYQRTQPVVETDDTGSEKTVMRADDRPKSDFNDGFYHQAYPRNSEPVTQTPGSQTSGASQPYTTRITSDQPRKKKSGGLSKGGVAILLVVCILLSGAAGFGGSILANKLNQPQYEENDSDTMVIHKVDTEAQVAGTENLVDKSTAEITNEVADTVVEITTEVMQTSSFYGQYVAQGAGSGVIISDDGYILTNNHVIDGASSIKVTTRSGETYDATVKGLDSKVDIALLKIEATDLPTAVMGDSSKLQVGSKAVIIGNPLGTLGGSVTEGIISALDRSIDIDGKTMHLIQTDASINPGNSGGGMFNGQGELTGIVVAKSSSEEIDNIGFVIPINNVLSILGDLKDYGYVRGRADTGMEFIDLTNQMYAWYYYGSSETGVYVSSVDSGSNAAKAGFQKGDRIVSIDGTEVESSTEIETAISEKSAGDTVTFVISRNGKEASIDLTLDEAVPESSQSSSSSSSDNSGNSGNGGNYPGGGGNPGGGNPGGNPFGF